MQEPDNPSLDFPVLEPDMQIDFYNALRSIKNLYLFDSLRSTVSQLDLSVIDSQLYSFVQKDALKRVASFGLRGETIFPIPLVIENNPHLLGYYRLLFGFSKKKFYNAEVFGRFKTLEERGTIAEELSPQIPELCSSLIGTAQILIVGLDELSLQVVHDLQILTFGAALRGGVNNVIGAVAVNDVYNLLKNIVDPYVADCGEKHIKIKNAAKRAVMIKFLSDPDVHISERIGRTVKPLLSIEIKGGHDASNIFNRLGEAEKSHRTAKANGFSEFWTITGVDVNLDRAKEKSPTTTEFFNLSRLQDPRSEDYQKFKDLICSILGIQDTSSEGYQE